MQDVHENADQWNNGGNNSNINDNGTNNNSNGNNLNDTDNNPQVEIIEDLNRKNDVQE